ncbi:MAG TPA: hypothetical protein VMB50_01570 [Myxococcales bacterium]|nr:hypothetical protein [Myxococcales bacterium]
MATGTSGNARRMGGPPSGQPPASPPRLRLLDASDLERTEIEAARRRTAPRVPEQLLLICAYAAWRFLRFVLRG